MKPTRVALCLIVGLLLATSFVVAYAAGLGGSWSGNVTQSDTNTTYPVEMELYGTTGSVNYPSLKCGGELQFLSENGKKFSYRENITLGQDHCFYGGTHPDCPFASRARRCRDKSWVENWGVR